MSGFDDSQIPPIPSVMHKVLLFDPNHEEASAYELESMVSPDKGICSHLLKTANSAFYGRSGKVKTIRDAVTLIGLKNSKNLILMMSLRDLTLALKGKIFVKYMQELPVLTALVAFDLCKPARLIALREEVFLSGLLLKIGMAVFAYNRIRNYDMLLKESEAKDIDILELERSFYKIDHIETGKRLFQLWSMPGYLREVVSRQDFPPEEVSSTSDLLRITVLASVIARNFLRIPTPVAEKEKAFLIFEHYEMGEKKMAFYDREYYDILRDHPFYQVAITG